MLEESQCVNLFLKLLLTRNPIGRKGEPVEPAKYVPRKTIMRYVFTFRLKMQSECIIMQFRST